MPKDAPAFSVAALLSLGKPPYGAVSLLALATPALPWWDETLRFRMLVLTVTIVAAQATWAFALRGKTVVWAPGADPQAQLNYVIDQPLDAATFLVKDFLAASRD